MHNLTSKVLLRTAADHPLTHSAPLFTGNARFPLIAIPAGPLATRMPHCRAQYGQWVAVGAALMRHRKSKMPSGRWPPEVVDTKAILAAFAMSDRRISRDENVPWQRIDDRNVGCRLEARSVSQFNLFSLWI